ncbi:hypothetical protein WICPIJ_000083 [Wickerhamomyces pijperi]|uniref:FYVE-type domain-containing protein n=1 Tax=Wickerhamomyces pijperi TaxID=599730 RepID=A0A9P8TSD2_WICPI|nr:hypothetical protein WICPIJ_000083 [Wickerhamomyces pijperi]
MTQQETTSTLISDGTSLANGRDSNILINSSEDLISGKNNLQHELLSGRSQSDRIPRTMMQPSFTEQRSKSNTTSRKGSNDSESAIQDQDLPSEITFEKRSIPKTRTTSIQSVLSSVSLRSLAQQNIGYMKNRPHSAMSNKTPSSNAINKGSFVPPSSETQSQFINTKAHIQAPATAASSKLPSSFEIGQRLPFIKDNVADSNRDEIEQVESDGEGEDDGKLTVDALKNLTNFSRFIPAEVDLNITDAPDKLESSAIEEESVVQSHTTLPSAASNLSLNNFGSFNSLHQSSSTTHLQALRQPQPVTPFPHSPIIRKEPLVIQSNETKSRLLSSTTSSQNLPMIRPSSNLRKVTSNQLSNSPKPASDISNASSPLVKSRTGSPQSNVQPHQHQSTLLSVPLSHSSSIDSNVVKGISDLKRPMYLPAVLRQSPTNLNKDDVERINAEKLEKSRRMNSQYKSHTIGSSSANKSNGSSAWKLPFNDQGHASLDSTISEEQPRTSRASFSAMRTSRSLMNLHINLNQPTRAHWRRDTTRKCCAYCSKPFTFFDRRHHCRKCGDIFCSEHTSHMVKLNEDAQFLNIDVNEFEKEQGILCKVCDGCYKQYEDIIDQQYNVVSATNNATSTATAAGTATAPSGKSSSSSRTNDNTTRPTNGTKANSTEVTSNLNITSKDHTGTEEDKSNEQVVGSVPVDWTWSSF